MPRALCDRFCWPSEAHVPLLRRNRHVGGRFDPPRSRSSFISLLSARRKDQSTMKTLPPGKVPAVCCRIGDDHRRYLQGTQLRRCYLCDSRIAVASSTLAMHGVVLICIECAVPFMKKGMQALPPTPEQLQDCAENTISDSDVRQSHESEATER
jgi:hypothetical protein